MHDLFYAIYVHRSRILIDMVYAKLCCLTIVRALDFGPLPHETYKPELLSMTLPGYAHGKIQLHPPPFFFLDKRITTIAWR